MAYYQNRKEFFGGLLILYQRDLNTAVPNSKTHRRPNWYMKAKIDGRWRERSTKHAIYEDAYEYAKKEFLRLQQNANLGFPLEEYTFEEHWDEWFQGKVRTGEWDTKRTDWHRGYGTHFKKYFSQSGESLLLNEITPKKAKEYWDWRRSDDGKRSASDKVLAPKTLQMEQTALNQIFFDASELGRLQQVIKFRAPRFNDGVRRRPDFDWREYKSMIQQLRHYRDCEHKFKKDKVNEWHKLQRKQLYYFVVFMAGSGLRIGEARHMKWEDVDFSVYSESLEQNIVQIEVRKSGKTRKNRFVQAQPSARKALLDWQKETPFQKTADYVWFGQQKQDAKKQAKFSDLNKSFQNFLGRTTYNGRIQGLLFNKENEKRSLYSLRHFYATQRLEKGEVSIYDLSINMGCRVAQIERHYSHTNSQKKRAAITASKSLAKAELEKKEAARDALSEIEASAVAAFKRGEIDQSTFLQIVKPPKVA